MPVNANTGIFTKIYTWVQDALNGVKISANRFDAQENDIANAINAQMDRAGKKRPTADWDMNQFKLTNLRPGSNTNDGATYGQIQALLARHASTTAFGNIMLATLAEGLAGTDTQKAITPNILKMVVDYISNQQNSLPPNYVWGFANNINDQIRYNLFPGAGYDSAGQNQIVLPSNITKDTTIVWSEGNNGGTLPSSISNISGRFYLFVISKVNSPATPGKLTTTDISANITNFQQCTNGAININVDGIDYQLTGLNFSTVGTVADIAMIINGVLQHSSIVANGNTLVWSSNKTGSQSSVSISSAASGTDLYGAAYLNGADATTTDGYDVAFGTSDSGIDIDPNASNLMATSGAPYVAGYRYFKLIGIGNLNNGQISGLDSLVAPQFQRPSVGLGTISGTVSLREGVNYTATIGGETFFALPPIAAHNTIINMTVAMDQNNSAVDIGTETYFNSAPPATIAGAIYDCFWQYDTLIGKWKFGRVWVV
ncbi:MAG: DUF3383 domain-containing protein [Rickettsiales bacterium]|jgi:hypothetical protein|nr:DUF3383 domain-containing protein [Rickettsiales bacterium]